MPTFVTEGRILSYETWGAGPVAMLIHGSPGNAHAWARVGGRLADRYRVIAPDLPGYRATTPEAADRSSVGYAAELIEALAGEVGTPAVLAGHSFGGVVALAVALRGRVRVGSLALFEPVAVPVLATVGDADAFAKTRSTFADYIASVESGNPGAIRTMVDFWFGDGAFDRLPPAVTTGLMEGAPANARDVRATFQETYSAEGLRRLPMPIVTVVGDRSPDVTHRIAHALAACSGGFVTPLAGADHAMTTTHVEEVAAIIANTASEHRLIRE
jgi:pimeloyl-ACP methyl ester carboxylesterase